jgi:hypothetical protein
MHAGDVLSTATTGGSYLLFVEKGDAIVYTTESQWECADRFQRDHRHLRRRMDYDLFPSSISTGTSSRICALMGKRLTDSDNNATNGFDGRVVLNNQIEKIELRSLTQADLPAARMSWIDWRSAPTRSLATSMPEKVRRHRWRLDHRYRGSSAASSKVPGRHWQYSFRRGRPSNDWLDQSGTAVSGQFFSFGRHLPPGAVSGSQARISPANCSPSVNRLIKTAATLTECASPTTSQSLISGRCRPATEDLTGAEET